MDVLIADLIAGGQPELASRCNAIGDTFTNWRWGALLHWARKAIHLRASIQEGFVRGHYRLQSDVFSIVARVASGGIEDEEFWGRTAFWVAVLEETESLRSWGTGCSCHEAERRAGQRVACALAGRRARWAWARVKESMAKLDEATLLVSSQEPSSSGASFGNMAQLFAQCSAALRAQIFCASISWMKSQR